MLDLQKNAVDWIAAACVKNKMHLALAESCTGGLLSFAFTRYPGASEYLSTSVVAYATELKTKLLGVSAKLIEEHTTTSEQVALAMLEGVKRISGAKAAIATTGLAGPGVGPTDIPVGTVWIAASWGDLCQTCCLHLHGSREEVMQEASNTAVLLIFELAKCKNAIV